MLDLDSNIDMGVLDAPSHGGEADGKNNIGENRLLKYSTEL